MALIEACNLIKTFALTKRRPGLRGALLDLIRPEKRTLIAVNNISFSIDSGEIVGYLGPNGAGKSTTIKMLIGILRPTSGTIRIDGRSPLKDRINIAKSIGVVWGNRSQLIWDLPLNESFLLLKHIYDIPDSTYSANLEWMYKLFNLQNLAGRLVRQLSLGERMRGELAAAILHSPSILFLDEPTIGFDFQAKQAVREYILEINRQKNTTVILTTHDLEDVEHLCQRLIIVNHGRIIADELLNVLFKKLAPFRIIKIVFYNLPETSFDIPFGQIIKQDETSLSIRFDPHKISAPDAITFLFNNFQVKDISILDPDIVDVIGNAYKITT